ncbi:MAG: tRNA pseudouridine(55) synthase TruB [Spirochaetaceae bacterium]|nr:MAG: tRNA pseudouridine(55) synthase TruB [Spirochaetaceae bacterium]
MSTDGLTLLDKPAGMTSFTALSALKSRLGTRRIGHTGTLDKFATGLLVVLVGKYTRLADLFSGLDKCYRATIVLGRRTDTLDPEGRVIEEGFVPDLAAIQEAARKLTGTIDQIPPIYSAVHVQGRRAYRIARSGGEPELEPRRVNIYRIELVAYRAPKLDIEVECSKGTYVRALARDLGEAAGSCGYVQTLRRTRVGPFAVEEAVVPDSFSGVGALADSPQRLLRLDGITALTVKDKSMSRVQKGQVLMDSCFTRAPKSNGLYALFDRRGNLLGMAFRDGGGYRYRMVL